MISLGKALSQTRIEKVPRGWLTKDQLAKAEGVVGSGGGFNYTVRLAVRAGLLEVKKFRVVWGEGVRARPFFRRVK